ncbi:MAG: FAD-dependent monooxygenase [Solirubrobacterales bacterium]
MAKRDILIVGGGLAGLSAAAMLQAHGFDVQLIERAKVLQAAGAGITLHPNARAALGPLDGEIARHGAEIREQVVEDRDGVRSRLAWDAVWDGSLPLGIERGVLADRLHSVLEPETVIFGTHPVDLAQRADAVEVRLSNEVTNRYRLVLGADGIRSWMRAHVVDPAAQPHYLGQVYWRTVAPAKGALALSDWHVWRNGPHYAGGLPVGHGRAHFFLQMAAAEIPKLDKDGLHELFRKTVAEFPKRLGSIAASLDKRSLAFTAASSLTTSRWAVGRVGLLGDAAHALSPASTQGGAMAIEDARVLTEELCEHGPEPAALVAYAERRRPRVDLLQRLTRMHLMLLESDMPKGIGSQRTREISPVTWYQQLYGPMAKAA